MAATKRALHLPQCHSIPHRQKWLRKTTYNLLFPYHQKKKIFNGKDFVHAAKCQHEILLTLLDDINLSVTLE